LLGIVTDRDIRSAMPSALSTGEEADREIDRVSRLKVKDIMSRRVVTISPMHTLQDALLLMQRTKVGAFPVLDPGGRLIGIISVRDLMRAFINVLGIEEPGDPAGNCGGRRDRADEKDCRRYHRRAYILRVDIGGPPLGGRKASRLSLSVHSQCEPRESKAGEPGIHSP